MTGDEPDRTQPGKATEQVEELELDDEQQAAEPLEWPAHDPERADPEHDTTPVHGANRADRTKQADGSRRVDGPEEEALHEESDRRGP